MQKPRLNLSSKMCIFLYEIKSYIYVQLFNLNCIEKDLIIAIKVKLQERFKIILSITQK